jgi:hypothetical protein
MKLKDELPGVIAKLEKIKDRIPPYAQKLRASGEYKNFETRLSWDCLRAVIGTNGICDLYEKYDCNDTHIGTLARQALRAVYKEV